MQVSTASWQPIVTETVFPNYTFESWEKLKNLCLPVELCEYLFLCPLACAYSTTDEIETVRIYMYLYEILQGTLTASQG